MVFCKSSQLRSENFPIKYLIWFDRKCFSCPCICFVRQKVLRVRDTVELHVDSRSERHNNTSQSALKNTYVSRAVSPCRTAVNLIFSAFVTERQMQFAFKSIHNRIQCGRVNTSSIPLLIRYNKGRTSPYCDLNQMIETSEKWFKSSRRLSLVLHAGAVNVGFLYMYCSFDFCEPAMVDYSLGAKSSLPAMTVVTKRKSIK